MSTAEVLSELDRIIGEVSTEERPGLVVALSARLATIAAGMARAGQPDMTSAPEPEDLLDMPAVAKELRVPLHYARELGRRGKLPVVQLGRYVRVLRADLRAYVASQRLPINTRRYVACHKHRIGGHARGRAAAGPRPAGTHPRRDGGPSGRDPQSGAA